MNHVPALWALVAFAAMGASATLHAQARGSLSREARSTALPVERPPLVQDEATRARTVAEMEAWLGRLVGKFRVDARRTNRDPYANKDVTVEFKGTAQCSGIGEGPGVRCLIREPVAVPATPRDRDRYLGTASVLYFGINPDRLEIQALVIEVQWVAARSGVLTGDTVAFSFDDWKNCQREVWKTCWVVTEVTARPAAEIFMKIFVSSDHGARMANGHTSDIQLTLHRVVP